MSTRLGKRKRERAKIEEAPLVNRGDTQDELQEVLRRAFERKFKPLDGSIKIVNQEDVASEHEETDDDSDWGGFESEGDAAQNVEIVEYADVKMPEELADIGELKKFMVSGSRFLCQLSVC